MSDTPVRFDAADDDDAAASLEFGRWLFAQECQFIEGAASLAQIPETEFPEIAFAGRSNVGKSSLINALTGRKTLARISNTPGRTQQINFFVLAERMILADLPGYGFARAPKEAVQRWTRMVETYLKGRVPLARCILLIDSRHGLKANDNTIMDMLDTAAVSYQIVLTKADKPSVPQVDACLAATVVAAAKRPAAHPDVLVTSAETGRGIAELRAVIAELAVTQQLG
jgi:GTP-binding protein